LKGPFFIRAIRAIRGAISLLAALPGRMEARRLGRKRPARARMLPGQRGFRRRDADGGDSENNIVLAR
jgi:hypothetical protein